MHHQISIDISFSHPANVITHNNHNKYIQDEGAAKYDADDEVEQNDLEYAIAMAQEDLLEPTVQLSSPETLEELRDKNKKLASLFKDQKRNYKHIIKAVTDPESRHSVSEMREAIKKTRLEIFQGLSDLQIVEDKFKNSEASVLGNIFGLGPTEFNNIRSKKGDDGKPIYKCPKCDFQKMSKGAVETHLVEQHDLKELQCPLCDFCSTNGTVLQQHCKKQHGFNTGGLKIVW